MGWDGSSTAAQQASQTRGLDGLDEKERKKKKRAAAWWAAFSRPHSGTQALSRSVALPLSRSRALCVALAHGGWADGRVQSGGLRACEDVDALQQAASDGGLQGGDASSIQRSRRSPWLHAPIISRPPSIISHPPAMHPHPPTHPPPSLQVPQYPPTCIILQHAAPHAHARPLTRPSFCLPACLPARLLTVCRFLLPSPPPLKKKQKKTKGNGSSGVPTLAARLHEAFASNHAC